MITICHYKSTEERNFSFNLRTVVHLSKADGGGRRLEQGGCKLSLSNLMRLQLIVEGNLSQLARFISAASEDFIEMSKNRRGKWRRRSEWRT